MMKRIASVVFAALAALLLLAAFRGGLTTSIVINAIQSIKIGAGGYVTGIDICTDGTKRVRNDTYGGYQWDGVSTWNQVVTQTQWPAANFGYTPNPGTTQVLQNGGGAYEFIGAPSQCATAYIVVGSNTGASTGTMQVYKTTDNGAHYLNLNFPGSIPLNTGSGPADAFRQGGKKAAVDPSNPNIAYFGTMQSGVYFTSDGSTFTQISTGTIPVSSGAANSGVATGYNIAFDPSTTTSSGCPGGGTCTGTIYIFSGGNGLYVSTDAGTTWALKAGGPSFVQHLVVAPSGGTMAAVGSVGSSATNGDLYTYTAGGGWVQNSASGTTQKWHSVAIDPNDATHWVLLALGGGISVSANSGTAWATSTSTSCIGTCSRANGDAPWLAAASSFFMTTGDLAFDGNVLWMTSGLGVWTVTPPTNPSSTPFAWAPKVNGIENLQAIRVMAPNGVPIVANSDVAFFYLPNFLSANASAPSIISTGQALSQANSIDYASSNKSFIAASITADTNPPDLSSSSADGGQTLLPFNTWNVTTLATNAFQCGGSGIVSTDICLTVSSTVGLTSWSATGGSPGSSGDIVQVIALNPTSNAGIANGNAFPVNVVSPTVIELRNSTFAAAQATNGGSLFVYKPAQATSLHNGAAILTNAVAGTAGIIRVTWTTLPGQSLSGLLLAGQRICIDGTASGTTEANGCWVATNVNTGSRTVDLFGSSFTNAWTAGSVANMKIVSQPGGSIAASTPSNLIRVMGNEDYAYCTTNAGADGWPQLVFPGAPQFTTLTGMTYVSSATFTATISDGSGGSGHILNVSAVGSGTLTVGKGVGGTGITGSVPVITSQTSGSAGGVGTYVISGSSFLIGSEPMTSGTVTFTTATPLNVTATSGNNQFIITNMNPAGHNGLTFTAGAGTTASSPIAPAGDPGGSYVSGGNITPPITGWPFSTNGFNPIVVAADRVTPNTFYGFNYSSGFYQITNCGTAVLINSSSVFGGTITITGSNGSTTLRTVPGEAGHFFFTPGFQGSAGANHPASTSMYRTCNAQAGAGAMTLAAVPGFFEPQAVGYAAIKPGQAYPAIYVVGWYDAGNVRANALYGVWRSVDDGSHGSTTTCTNGTWQNIVSPAAVANIYPGGWQSPIRDVNGDLTNYAKFFLAGSNKYMYGNYPFLLKRDLDPASNDNDPMWLEKAA